MFPQRGPPTERSGYVHLEGLHTGLLHDAVTVRRNNTKKRGDMSEGFKIRLFWQAIQTQAS